jgi:hypothetical protein
MLLRINRLVLSSGLVLTTLPAAALAGPSVNFEYTTAVDATPAGGNAVTPLRVIYNYDTNLPSGSGPFGTADDGTFDSYAPLSSMVIELGNQCVFVKGAGTSGSVFNNAGPNEDSIDFRAEPPATTNKKLLNHNFVSFRFLLVDPDGTMFSDTSLPTSPDFADDADFQQTDFELTNRTTGRRVRMNATDAPFTFGVYDPAGAILGIKEDVQSLNVNNALKNSLLKLLNDARGFLGDQNRANDSKGKTKLKDFIAAVKKERGRKLSRAVADSLVAAAQSIINDMPAC